MGYLLYLSQLGYQIAFGIITKGDFVLEKKYWVLKYVYPKETRNFANPAILYLNQIRYYIVINITNLSYKLQQGETENISDSGAGR